MDRNRILILGASSYVGQHLFAKLGSNRAIATFNRNPIENGIYFNSVSMRLAEIIENPEAISHAVILLGDTDPDRCAADVAKSNAINVHSIKTIIDDLASWGIKPIFASSEFIFDGVKGNYVEDDPANPILVYGQQKFEIEKHLCQNYDEYVIFRLAKTFGNRRDDGTLFTNWIEAIDQGRTIRCAHDQYFCPIFIDDVVESICRLIDLDCNGVFHLSSTQRFSRIALFEMLEKYIREVSTVEINMIPCSIHDFQLQEKRPLDVSMIPDKLVRATGIQMSDVEMKCSEIVYDLFHNGKLSQTGN